MTQLSGCDMVRCIVVDCRSLKWRSRGMWRGDGQSALTVRDYNSGTGRRTPHLNPLRPRQGEVASRRLGSPQGARRREVAGDTAYKRQDGGSPGTRSMDSGQAGDATNGKTARPWPEGASRRRSAVATRGYPPHICKSAKRSQCFGVLYVVDWLEGQCVRTPSESVCHLASFLRNGFVWGFREPIGRV